MPTLAETLQVAFQHYQNQELEQAERIYREVLSVDPRNFDALHLLGLLAYRTGRYDDAIERLRGAVEVNAAHPVAHTNLGAAFRAAGRRNEARDAYEQALKLKPDYAEALNNLGNVHKDERDFAKAQQSYERALQIKPDYAEAYNNLGNLFKEQGQYATAKACYEQALKIKPDYAAAQSNLGNAYKDQRQLAEARTCYEQALRIKPDYAEGHNNLGVVLQDLGELFAAEGSYREALRLKPDYADAHNNLGTLCRALRRLKEAEACFHKALELKPDFFRAHNNLGNCLKDQRRFDEARARFEQALALHPQYVDAMNNLGVTLQEQKKLAEAQMWYRRALEIKPDYAAAHNNLGTLLNAEGKWTEAQGCYERAVSIAPDYLGAHDNLGQVLQAQGKWVESQAAYERVLALDPRHFAAHNRLGTVLQSQGKLPEAHKCYEEALRLKPDFHDAHNNLGTVHSAAGLLAEAQACYERALQLFPEYAEAHNNLGNCYKAHGNLAEAEARYQRAIGIKPDYADAHLHLALIWLELGRLDEAWPEYEWRWKTKNHLPLLAPDKLWDGSPLAGRTILLHAEQGLGDTLQFIRYAPLVKRQGGTVIVQCQPPLLKLLGACAGIDQLIPRGVPIPAFDVHAPLVSLPRLMGTTLATIPANIPYIEPDPRLVEQWESQLNSIPEFKIGIAWQGNPKFGHDRWRSISLKHFEPLARLEGVRLFSLQKGLGSEQVGEVSLQVPVTDLSSQLDEKSGAFMDTAAVMRHMDLIITSDTSVPHLAGALGVPVWVALPFAADWRWLHAREDIPWYPTMRLFRQTQRGDWPEVFERLANEVKQLLAARGGAPPLLVEIAPGELIDKITILEIKSERMTDPEKLRNVEVERQVLTATRAQRLVSSERLIEWTRELKCINEVLWDIEDEIRECELRQDFGSRFIELARAVYMTNDRRALMKRKINELLGSRLVEEKAYAPYAAPETTDEVEAHPARAAEAPIVSVIMPVFNGARYLTRAIESLRAQSFPNWELIAVDDGSTDGSYELLCEFAKADSRICPLRSEENRGPSAARNQAIQHACGEMIAYLDCDDEYDPGHLGRVHTLRAQGELLVFSYDLYREGEGDAPPRFSHTWHPESRQQMLAKFNIVCPLGVAHRRELFTRAGLFDETISYEEDWDLWKRFAQAQAKFVYSAAKSGRYFVRAGSQSRTRRIPSENVAASSTEPVQTAFLSDLVVANAETP